jgi:hypothetical protein
MTSNTSEAEKATEKTEKWIGHIQGARLDEETGEVQLTVSLPWKYFNEEGTNSPTSIGLGRVTLIKG